MELDPLVSVLMTSYNRESFIGEAISSVLSSTYKNFELIIVDDCSSDKTVQIAEGYANSDARVKVYINERNLGDYPNRNKAASLASGKYIKYVDADDYIYPFGLEVLVGAMEKFPFAGYGLCSLPQSRERPFPFSLSPAEAYQYNYFGPGLFHKAPLSSIIRKDIFENVGGFESRRMVGDFLMWHKLSRYYHVVLIQEGVVWYREHDLQESVEMGKFRYDYANIVIEAINDSDCPLTSPQKNILNRKLRDQFVRSGIKKILRLKAVEGLHDFRIANKFR